MYCAYTAYPYTPQAMEQDSEQQPGDDEPSHLHNDE